LRLSCARVVRCMCERLSPTSGDSSGVGAVSVSAMMTTLLEASCVTGWLLLHRIPVLARRFSSSSRFLGVLGVPCSADPKCQDGLDQAFIALVCNCSPEQLATVIQHLRRHLDGTCSCSSVVHQSSLEAPVVPGCLDFASPRTVVAALHYLWLAVQSAQVFEWFLSLSHCRAALTFAILNLLCVSWL